MVENTLGRGELEVLQQQQMLSRKNIYNIQVECFHELPKNKSWTQHTLRGGFLAECHQVKLVLLRWLDRVRSDLSPFFQVSAWRNQAFSQDVLLPYLEAENCSYCYIQHFQKMKEKTAQLAIVNIHSTHEGSQDFTPSGEGTVSGNGDREVGLLEEKNDKRREGKVQIGPLSTMLGNI